MIGCGSGILVGGFGLPKFAPGGLDGMGSGPLCVGHAYLALCVVLLHHV